MKGALLGIGLAALAVSLPGMEVGENGCKSKTAPLQQPGRASERHRGGERTAFLFPSRPVGSSDGRRDGENSV